VIALDQFRDDAEEFIKNNLKPEEWKTRNIEMFWETALAVVVGGFLPESEEEWARQEEEHRAAYAAVDEAKARGDQDEADRLFNLMMHERHQKFQDMPDRDRLDPLLLNDRQKALLIHSIRDIGEMAERYQEAPAGFYGAYSDERIAYDAMRHFEGDLTEHAIRYEAPSEEAEEQLLNIIHKMVIYWLINVKGGVMDVCYDLMKPIYDEMGPGPEYDDE
jgi:hypothetical protein